MYICMYIYTYYIICVCVAVDIVKNVVELRRLLCMQLVGSSYLLSTTTITITEVEDIGVLRFARLAIMQSCIGLVLVCYIICYCYLLSLYYYYYYYYCSYILVLVERLHQIFAVAQQLSILCKTDRYACLETTIQIAASKI